MRLVFTQSFYMQTQLNILSGWGGGGVRAFQTCLQKDLLYKVQIQVC